MTEKLLMTTGSGLQGKQIAFVVHSDVSALPDRPGLYVLLGLSPQGRDRPLYFGFADSSILDQLPYDRGFAQAIRQGPVGFASAYLPSGDDPSALVAALAEAYDAPVNAAAAALADIEAAQSTIHAQAMARKIAAQ
jgi:hypothetical protein